MGVTPPSFEPTEQTQEHRKLVISYLVLSERMSMIGLPEYPPVRGPMRED